MDTKVFDITVITIDNAIYKHSNITSWLADEHQIILYRDNKRVDVIYNKKYVVKAYRGENE